MTIQVLLTPFAWLQASATVRNALSKEFGMTRSTSPRCVMEAGHTTIESDGFTVNDLMALNSESMQKWLGFATIDQEADIHALFGMCVDKMEKSLSPPPELAEVAPVIEEDIKKPFCAHCSSKGVKHKSDCTRPL